MVELYPHQQKAVDRLSNGKILYGDVGVGKSITALAYYYHKVCGGVYPKDGVLRNPHDLYIITTPKKRDDLDWHGDASLFRIFRDSESNVSGIKFTVDSWNNVSKYTEVKNAFFIFDEQRIVGSGTWAKSFIKIAKSNKWIVLSATPGDTWMDYISVFIANGWYKNRTEFKLEHTVWSYYGRYPKLERYLGVGKLARLRNDVLVEMPYSRKTKRNLHWVRLDFDRESMTLVRKNRWHIYEERPINDAAEMFSVSRRIANSDSSRLEALLRALREHSRLIVFYNFNYELEALRSALSDLEGIEVAEWNGHKHQPVPDSESWVYLVQYRAGSEGWNCITTDTVIFYSQTYSYKDFYQAQGRIDRLNTPYNDLHYYIFSSKSWIDMLIEKALRSKKDFNESSYGWKAIEAAQEPKKSG